MNRVKKFFKNMTIVEHMVIAVLVLLLLMAVISIYSDVGDDRSLVSFSVSASHVVKPEPRNQCIDGRLYRIDDNVATSLYESC